MTDQREDALLAICDRVYRAHKNAEDEHRREVFGNNPPIERLIMRRDKVRVEIRKETVNHHEPHLHVMHSDKIDASLSLRDFRLLAGKIDRRTMKHLLWELQPVRDELNAIWKTLNDDEDAVGAEKLISNLFG